MKAAEKAYRRVIPERDYLLIRLDGKAFHTYTKPFSKPYDLKIQRAMDDTLLALCEGIQGVKYGYVQSDEISLLLTNWKDGADGVSQFGEWWMGGVEAKILSISASIATAAFNESIRKSMADIRVTEKMAHFDSRLWTFPGTWAGANEVEDYFNWRIADCVKNSVTGAAHQQFGHKAILNKSTSAKILMLEEAGVPWADMPAGFRFGREAKRESMTGEVTYLDKRTNRLQVIEVTRNPFVLTDVQASESMLASYVPDPPHQQPSITQRQAAQLINQTLNFWDDQNKQVRRMDG